MDIHLPHKMKHFGYATTGDGKYVIISGGTYDILTSIDSINENKIFVFDIDNTQILESKILCPQCSLFHSIIMPEYNDISARIY